MALRHAIEMNAKRASKLVTAPAVEPITAAELRHLLKADVEDLGDSEANRLIQSSRGMLETLTGIAFITQVWELHLDHWPGYKEPWWDGVRDGAIAELQSGVARPVTLPIYPLQSLDECKTFTQANTEVITPIAGSFYVDTASTPGRLLLVRGKTWPDASRGFDAVVLTYTAGFGDDASDVPPILRDAVLCLAAYYHAHRGECDLMEAAKKSGALAMMSTYASRGL